MPSMRVSPAAAYPSARLAPVRAPSPDNSGASSAPSSSLPDLEAAAGPFLRLVGVAASFPASPSGRGAGDQNSRTLACRHEDISSWLQPNGCAAYGKQSKNDSKAETKQLGTEKQSNMER